MNYGRFFEFDFESSYLQEGVAVFNYRWLQKKDSGVMITPRYPVYLTFTPESIKFNLHFLQEESQEHSAPERLTHYHNTIIEIRLSPNVDVAKGLTDSFNNAYVAQFPLKAKVDSCRTIDDDLLDIIKKVFENQFNPIAGYSDLDCFEPETAEDYDISSKSTPHLLRKIILDFLYDLEFTNVFKNVAFYDTLSARLKENFLFNALLNKTRYYYYRSILCTKEVVDRCLRVGDEDSVKRCEQDLKFFFEQYSKAEHDWVTSILDDRALHIFHDSPWFDEVNEELEQVYYAERTGKWRKKILQKKYHQYPG